MPVLSPTVMTDDVSPFSNQPDNPWSNGIPEDTGGSESPSRRPGKILTGAVSAVVALTVGVGAGWMLGGQRDGGGEDGVPMYSGAGLPGFPDGESGNVPEGCGLRSVRLR